MQCSFKVYLSLISTLYAIPAQQDRAQQESALFTVISQLFFIFHAQKTINSSYKNPLFLNVKMLCSLDHNGHMCIENITLVSKGSTIDTIESVEVINKNYFMLLLQLINSNAKGNIITEACRM